MKQGGEGLRVLVAEDVPAAQKLVARLLEKLGHRVALAHNGRDAVRQVAAEPFDLVLMDIQMPEMDGYQATAAIRAMADPKKAAVKIVAMTAHTGVEQRSVCLSAGMDDCLLKPIDARLLAAVLDRLQSGAADLSLAPTSDATIHQRPAPGPGQRDGGCMPVLEPEEGIARCFGKPSMFLEMIESFSAEADTLLPQIRAAIERGEAAELVTLAHRLKGTLVYLGAPAALAAAREMEGIGLGGDLSAAPAAWTRLQTAVDRLQEALADYLVHGRGDSPAEKGLPPT